MPPKIQRPVGLSHKQQNSKRVLKKIFVPTKKKDHTIQCCGDLLHKHDLQTSKNNSKTIKPNERKREMRHKIQHPVGFMHKQKTCQNKSFPQN